jgi:hypothetical protein
LEAFEASAYPLHQHTIDTLSNNPLAERFERVIEVAEGEVEAKIKMF